MSMLVQAVISVPVSQVCSSRFCPTHATNVCRQKDYRFDKGSVIFLQFADWYGNKNNSTEEIDGRTIADAIVNSENEY